VPVTVIYDLGLVSGCTCTIGCVCIVRASFINGFTLLYRDDIVDV